MSAIGRPTGQRRVLVTGAAGWLGGALIARLSETSRYTVIGLRREDGDLSSPGVLSSLLGDGRSTTVVHLASSLDRSGTPTADRGQWRDTFEAGREVIQQSVAAGVTHIIAAGSMEELGRAEGVLSLGRAIRPETTYGLCKALVREVAEFEARRSATIIDWFRPTIVYGPGQRGSMLIPMCCEAARSGRDLDVTDGRQQRDFLFVDDLIEWLCLALERVRRATTPAARRRFTLHHLGTGRSSSVNSVVDQIESAFSADGFHRGARVRRLHEPSIQVAPAKGSSVAGWEARVSLEEGLARTINWWRNQDG